MQINIPEETHHAPSVASTDTVAQAMVDMMMLSQTKLHKFD